MKGSSQVAVQAELAAGEAVGLEGCPQGRQGVVGDGAVRGRHGEVEEGASEPGASTVALALAIPAKFRAKASWSARETTRSKVRTVSGARVRTSSDRSGAVPPVAASGLSTAPDAEWPFHEQ